MEAVGQLGNVRVCESTRRVEIDASPRS